MVSSTIYVLWVLILTTSNYGVSPAIALEKHEGYINRDTCEAAGKIVEERLKVSQAVTVKTACTPQKI